MVGTAVVTDPDAGQTKTFSILSGNINSAFAHVVKVQDSGTALSLLEINSIAIIVNSCFHNNPCSKSSGQQHR